jgi:hypothetical protein
LVWSVWIHLQPSQKPIDPNTCDMDNSHTFLSNFILKKGDCGGIIRTLCDLWDLFITLTFNTFSLLISNPGNLATAGSIYMDALDPILSYSSTDGYMLMGYTWPPWCPYSVWGEPSTTEMEPKVE